MSNGIRDISAERRRQIHDLGLSSDQDDAYDNFELTWAAITYANHATKATEKEREFSRPTGWPWADEWWRPGTRRRNLVKAGALIAAEIDRLDRLERTGGEQ